MKITVPDFKANEALGDSWRSVVDDSDETIGRVRGRQGTQWDHNQRRFEIELFNGQHRYACDQLGECYLRGASESAINSLMPPKSAASKVA